MKYLRASFIPFHTVRKLVIQSNCVLQSVSRNHDRRYQQLNLLFPFIQFRTYCQFSTHRSKVLRTKYYLFMRQEKNSIRRPWQNSFFLSILIYFSLSFDLFLPPHCKRRGLMWHFSTPNDTHTHTHSVGLFWTRDRSVAETSPGQQQHSQETGVYTPDGILTELRGIIKLTRTRHLKGDTVQETAGP